jgi:hypothetical protein
MTYRRDNANRVRFCIRMFKNGRGKLLTVLPSDAVVPRTSETAHRWAVERQARCCGVTYQWRLYISITSLRNASRLVGRV